MAGIARKIRRPGIDVVREQSRRAPLKIERMQNAVANSIRNGEERENCPDPQSRQRQQPIQPRVGPVGTARSRVASEFQMSSWMRIALVGSVLKGNALRELNMNQFLILHGSGWR